MTTDKRITKFLDSAKQKRIEGSGLTIKEWCALAGYGYDYGLAMIHQEGFPIFSGRVVWEDWTKWRQIKLGLATLPRSQSVSARVLAPVNKSGE
jgi:hypothetical protein